MTRKQKFVVPRTNTGRDRRTIWIVIIIVASFLTWSAYAPLEITVRGNGTVVPSLSTQVVQNLEGGIIKSIFVAAGDEVEAGQLLAQMDKTQFLSAFQELQEQHLSLLIRLQRLKAEKGDSLTFSPDDEYVALAPEYAASELALFSARRNDVLHQQETLGSLARLRRSEVDLLRPMVKRSAVPEIELIRAEQLAVEAEGRATAIRTEFEAARAEEYSEVLSRLRQTEKQLSAKRDQLERTEITSPVRGIVNRVDITTVGGVVGSGDPLVEILPLDQPLKIQGRIDPRDIGFTVVGMSASIKLTAFDFAIYGTLKGKVVHVGIDTVLDEMVPNSSPYYEVAVELDTTKLDGPTGPVEIRPGMLAVVELDAGRRTVLQYLLKPLFKSQEALREQ